MRILLIATLIAVGCASGAARRPAIESQPGPATAPSSDGEPEIGSYPACNSVPVAPSTSASATPPSSNIPGADGVIATSRWRFKSCYNTALARDPRAGGTIKVAVVIDATGATRPTLVCSTAQPGLTACIVEAFRPMRFTPPQDGSTAKFTVPVVLSAKH